MLRAFVARIIDWNTYAIYGNTNMADRDIFTDCCQAWQQVIIIVDDKKFQLSWCETKVG